VPLYVALIATVPPFDVAGAAAAFGFVVEKPVGHFGFAAVTFLTVVPL
jgi:hypothetical protein